MSISIAVKMTPQGLLIPRSALHDWLDQELEIIKEQQRIVIQPKTAPATERERVLQILETAGLLLPVESPMPVRDPLSTPEADKLARKFSIGRPLSEIIVEEREER
jgi:hypothetical protein